MVVSQALVVLAIASCPDPHIKERPMLIALPSNRPISIDGDAAWSVPVLARGLSATVAENVVLVDGATTSGTCARNPKATAVAKCRIPKVEKSWPARIQVSVCGQLSEPIIVVLTRSAGTSRILSAVMLIAGLLFWLTKKVSVETRSCLAWIAALVAAYASNLVSASWGQGDLVLPAVEWRALLVFPLAASLLLVDGSRFRPLPLSIPLILSPVLLFAAYSIWNSDWIGYPASPDVPDPILFLLALGALLHTFPAVKDALTSQNHVAVEPAHDVRPAPSATQIPQ